MGERESTSAVIAFKQRILREAPDSARMIEGKDRIFYRRQPGEDALLSGAGTVSYREGWGAQSHPTRYGGVLAADAALRLKGYRPYNIFIGSEWQMNEQRHKSARFERQKQQEVFQQTELPKVSKKDVMNNFYQRPPEMEYPSMEMPSPNNMVPSEMRPRQGSRLGYIDLLESLPDPIAQARSQKGLVMRQTFNDNDFARFAQTKLSALKSMERQLGIPSIGAAPIKYGVNKKSKGKAKWRGQQ